MTDQELTFVPDADLSAASAPTTGELQLDDRASLQRVAGLSTELTDVTEVEYRQLRLERVVLVGVWTSGTVAQAHANMAELAALDVHIDRVAINTWLYLAPIL